MDIDFNDQSVPGVYDGIDLYIDGLPGFDDEKHVLTDLPAFLAGQREAINSLFEGAEMRSVVGLAYGLEYTLNGRLRPEEKRYFSRKDLDRDPRQTLLDLLDRLQAIPDSAISFVAQAVALQVMDAQGCDPRIRIFEDRINENALPFC